MIGKNAGNAYSFRVPEGVVRVDSKDQGGVVEMELVKVVELLEEVEQLEVLEEPEEVDEFGVLNVLEVMEKVKKIGVLVELGESEVVEKME